MKIAWIGYNCISSDNDMLISKIADIIEEDDFNVELFGFDLYSDDIPKNGTIVDNGSRETLAIIADGEVITDPEEIEQFMEDEITDD